MSALLCPSEILDELAVTDPEDIDIELIAFFCGAEVQYAELRGCAAHIIGRNDRAVITVDMTSEEPRQRFSVAHELGHWMYDRGKALSCAVADLRAPWWSGNPEARANGFAAELLTPASLFCKRIDAQPVSFHVVEKVAHEFRVSRSAAARRLIELTSCDAMLLHFGPEGRRWFKGSRRVDGHLWPHRILSKDTDAWGILHGEKGAGYSMTVDADDWIDHYAAARYEIQEHSVPYADGVLTLLWWKDTSMVEEHVG